MGLPNFLSRFAERLPEFLSKFAARLANDSIRRTGSQEDGTDRRNRVGFLSKCYIQLARLQRGSEQ